MISQFKTPNKVYSLQVDPLCCNKFGLSELLVDMYGKLSLPSPRSVLDVGCGAGPLGIYFADQCKANVVGVELNPIACACCNANCQTLELADRFRLIYGNFQQFVKQCDNLKFDLIVANPPLDTAVTTEVVQQYVECDFKNIDPQSFAYLTNSWHDEHYHDLLDLIFQYGQQHLNQDGGIVIAFCLIECQDPAYVTSKAARYNYTCMQQIEHLITAESIGASNRVSQKLRAFVMHFGLQ